MIDKYHLYFDETGSRNPDNLASERNDKMDCFGLGGVLIKEQDIDKVIQAHKAFCHEHDITYPLHSWAIRGRRQKFGWLKAPEKESVFLTSLEEYLLSLPFIAIACVVHRPGYLARYKEKYKKQLWQMCRTAFSVLIERAAKYVDEQGGAMETYFEQTGRQEDRAIIQYMHDLKTKGPPFNKSSSGGYSPLLPEDFRRLCLGKPDRKTKKTPMVQIADLVLFPIAKAAYDPDYRPFLKLKEAGKLIDCHLQEDQRSLRGIKYSCFDE